MPPTCSIMDAESGFKLSQSVGVSSGYRVGAIAALHRYCKAKSYSYITETFFARCLKQWVTTAAAQGTLFSLGHHLQVTILQDQLPPLTWIVPPFISLRPTSTSFLHTLLSSLLSPLEAAWRLLLLASSKAHTAAWHSTCMAAVNGFFLHTRRFPQNGARGIPAPQNTIFSPSY